MIAFVKIFEQVVSAQCQQWPNDGEIRIRTGRPLGGNATEAGNPCAADQAVQNCLGLIIGRMPGCQPAALAFFRNFLEPLIAQFTG